ncbi:hypothetical protein NH26_23140 [Flammeovirga pacifica]|uniref:Uncharacterized protein n=1 Tax=Flammeovirga pacifica TaxID=915059 RepID=A0A1S1YTY5_FLAPC|nr:hypothetical protein NH26_23140 [Flammeovirga pacifica]
MHYGRKKSITISKEAGDKKAVAKHYVRMATRDSLFLNFPIPTNIIKKYFIYLEFSHGEMK